MLRYVAVRAWICTTLKKDARELHGTLSSHARCWFFGGKTAAQHRRVGGHKTGKKHNGETSYEEFFVAAKCQSLNRQCDGCLESSGDIQYSILWLLGKIYEHLVWGKARLCFYSMLLNWQLHATVFPKYIDGGHECGPSLSSWGVNVL